MPYSNPLSYPYFANGLNWGFERWGLLSCGLWQASGRARTPTQAVRVRAPAVFQPAEWRLSTSPRAPHHAHTKLLCSQFNTEKCPKCQSFLYSPTSFGSLSLRRTSQPTPPSGPHIWSRVPLNRTLFSTIPARRKSQNKCAIPLGSPPWASPDRYDVTTPPSISNDFPSLLIVSFGFMFCAMVLAPLFSAAFMFPMHRNCVIHFCFCSLMSSTK